MHVVIVEFTIHAEKFDAFVTRVCQQAEDSLRLEADCRVFDVCVSPERKNRVLLYEVYRDEDAFRAHLESAHFHNFNAAVEDWVSGKSISSYERI